MDEKWLKSAYQFESEPSGGGEPAPEPAAEPAPEPSHEPIDDGGEPAPEPTPEPEPAPAGPVKTPDGIRGLFRPQEPVPQDRRWEPPPTQDTRAPEPTPTPEAPPKVDFPTPDEWEDDPGKAAQKQAAALRWENYQSTQPLLQTIQELRSGFDRRQTAEMQAWEQRIAAVQDQAATKADSFWAEDGPLNEDAEFRNNPQLQEAVEVTIGTVLQEALRKAHMNGDPSGLERIATDPRFPYRCLAIAKADMKKVHEPGLRPTASPVGPQGDKPKPKPEDQLSREDREALEAARADGSSLTAKDLLAAQKKTQESVY